MNFEPNRRRAGLLVPVFALRGNHDIGIGDTEAFDELLTWAGKHRIAAIQMLPINETGGDNSPYNAISSRAICPTTVAALPGLLPGLDQAGWERLILDPAVQDLREGAVQYARIKALKLAVLRRAFDQFRGDPSFDQFRVANQSWLEPYALFRLLVDAHEGSAVWESWQEPFHDAAEATKWLAGLPLTSAYRLDLLFWQFVQWVAYKQWEEIKARASGMGIELIGDIPFGISRCSADVWAHPELFDTGWSGGAPPETNFQHDRFVAEFGQNWGIPLYKWEKHWETDLAWWKQRVGGLRACCHGFRIDHVLGFYRIYSFPWTPDHNLEVLDLTKEEITERFGALPQFKPRPDTTAEASETNCAEGEKLLALLVEAAAPAYVIAEDLGMVPPYVRPSLTKLGIPGFKIPIFERDWDGDRHFLPGNDFEPLSLVTPSTHDHMPMALLWKSWVEQDDKTSRQDQQCLLDWIGWTEESTPTTWTDTLHAQFVQALFQSTSALAILQLPDWFGTEHRFNVPGEASDANWSARVAEKITDWDSVPSFLTHTQINEQAIQLAGR